MVYLRISRSAAAARSITKNQRELFEAVERHTMIMHDAMTQRDEISVRVSQRLPLILSYFGAPPPPQNAQN